MDAPPVDSFEDSETDDSLTAESAIADTSVGPELTLDVLDDSTYSESVKEETLVAEALSWISTAMKSNDRSTSNVNCTAGDSITPEENISTTNDSAKETKALSASPQPPSPIVPSRLPSKLPSSAKIQSTQSSEESSNWAERGAPSRRLSFFNCACAGDVNDDMDRAAFLKPGRDGSGSLPITQNMSFVTAEGFETVLDMNKRIDDGYTMMASLSNLSKDLFWSNNDANDCKDEGPASVEESELSTSSSDRSGPHEFIPRGLSHNALKAPRATALFNPDESTMASSNDSGALTPGQVPSSQRPPTAPSSSYLRMQQTRTAFTSRVGHRSASTVTSGSFAPQKLSVVSSIKSNTTPFAVRSVTSQSTDFSDSKYDEAARKIFRVAEKLGISPDDLIDQLEKGESIEKLTRRVQRRSQQ